MTKFVSIHANGDDGQVVTVTEAFAEGIGAKTLEYPALDASGRPRAPRSEEEAKEQLKAANDAAKAAEKPAKKAAASSTTSSGDAGANA
jgi:hypothetical protein